MSASLQFGFSLFPYARFRDPREMLELVQEAESLGFDAVGLPEHVLPPAWPDADLITKYWLDLPTLAAFLAAGTSRIRLLTTVLVVPYHPPVQMARQLATLDVLSGGRLWLGVGTGWMRAEFRRLGIPFEERGAITGEYLRAMVALWTSDAPKFHGRYVSFEDVSCLPRPVHQPHIPIFVGGTGPRPFRRVAELGQGWLPMTTSLAQLPGQIAEIRHLMAANGRGDEPLWVGYGISMGSDAAVASMRNHVDGGAGESALCANPAEAIERASQLRDAGVAYLSVGFAWERPTELIAGLRQFAAEVMPAFR